MLVAYSDDIFLCGLHCSGRCQLDFSKCFLIKFKHQLETIEPRICSDISAMSRRVASASRGRSRGRSRARKSSPNRKSFEELFNDENRVAKLRRQYQQKYPKKKVDELVAWLGDARVLCDAGKTLLELQSWDPDFMTDPDFSEMRSNLFESREDLLRRAAFPSRSRRMPLLSMSSCWARTGRPEASRNLVHSFAGGNEALNSNGARPPEYFRWAPRLFWFRTHRRLKA